MNKPTHIIVHHSGVQTPHSQFGTIDAYHKSIGHTLSTLGFYVGYHKHIAPNGFITTARRDEEVGEHTLLGWNTKSIGVCLDGDFSKNVPTQAQLSALRAIIKHYNLPFMFHKDADPKRTCAGFYFTRQLIETANQNTPAGETEKAKELTKYYKAIKISERFGLPLQTVLNWL